MTFRGVGWQSMISCDDNLSPLPPTALSEEEKTSSRHLGSAAFTCHNCIKLTSLDPHRNSPRSLNAALLIRYSR